MATGGSRKVRAARKRKRRMERVEHDLTDEQWVALQAAWGGCAYCGAAERPLQRDCVLAISRGGRYSLSNVVPVCGSCNASKSNDEVTRWLRRKRLDERNFLARHVAITATLALQFPPEPEAPDSPPAADETFIS
jgi:5-methylcytosine-specific restriction endonuclease McrA